MATNQRENERRARKNAKKRKSGIILWIVLIVIIAVLAVMKICEIDFSGIKDVISGNSSVSLTEAVSDEEKFPYVLDSGNDVIVSSVGNKLCILNDLSYTVINSSDAKETFKADHGFANPVMKTSGDYAVVYDQGAHKYSLNGTNSNIYQDTCSNTILCADVSDAGIVALATTSDEAKSEIVVYNKSLKEKMKYAVSYGYITAIAIDNRGSRLAFAAVNSENAVLKTVVYTMSMGDDKPRAEFSYNSSSVIDLHFCSANLYIVGTDFLSVVSSMKNETKVYEQGTVNTASYCYNSADNLVFAYSEYTGSLSGKVAYIAPSGKIKSQADVGAEIKDITASGSEFSVLTNDSVISYKLSDGSEKGRINADDTYTSIQQMSSKIFGKRRTFIELLSD